MLPVEELFRVNVIPLFARALYNVPQTFPSPLSLLFGLCCLPLSTLSSSFLSLLIWLFLVALYHCCVVVRCLLRQPQQIKASAFSYIYRCQFSYVACYEWIYMSVRRCGLSLYALKKNRQCFACIKNSIRWQKCVCVLDGYVHIFMYVHSMCISHAFECLV